MKPNPIIPLDGSGAGSLGRWRAGGRGLDLGTLHCIALDDGLA